MSSDASNPAGDSPVSPPPGWTFDPEELDYELDWVPEDGCGRELAALHGLYNCTPIMYNDDNQDHSGTSKVMFECDGKYYIWFQMIDTIAEIRSLNLEEIIASFKEDGWKKIGKKLKEMQQISRHVPASGRQQTNQQHNDTFPC